MNKFKSLLKYSFINSFNLNKAKGLEKQNKSKMSTAGIVVLAVIIFIYLFVMYGAVVNILTEYKLPMEFLLLLTFVSGVMATIYSALYRAPGVIFRLKDYDLLSSLPIDKKSIVGVKLADLLITSYAFMAVIMLPSLIIYYKTVGFTFISFIINIIAVIALPLIPMGIGVFIGGMIYLISSKFRLKEIAVTVINVLLITCFVGLAYSIEKWGPYLLQNIEGFNKIIEYVYLPFKYYSNALMNGSIIDILIYLAISIGIFVVFILIIQSKFSKINSRFNISAKGKVVKISDGKKKSQVKSLFKSELIRYISKSSVVLNTGINGIIYILLIFAYGSGLIDTSPEYMAAILISTGIILFSITPTTATSISLEGQAFYMLKSLPIKFMEIIKAKILLNLIINIPFVVISSIIIHVMDLATITQTITAMFTIMLSILFSSIVGIIVNMNKYNFKWESEAVVVKRGESVYITTIILVLINLPLAGCVVVNLNMALVIYTVLFLVAAWVLKKYGENMWNKIS